MALLRARGQKQPSQEPVMDAVAGTARRVSAAFLEGQEKLEFTRNGKRVRKSALI